jgi:hypothetical protein
MSAVSNGSSSWGWMLGATVAVLRHQIARLAPRQWWRRPPFLPLPDPNYLRFRLITAYGGEGADPQPGDLITYLHWCRAWPEVTSGS